MRFEWDEKKRGVNLKNHGVDFQDVRLVFEMHHLTIPDKRFEYPEDRFLTIGLLRDIVIAVAHTEDENKIRVISARKATKNEAKTFFKSF